LLAAGARAASPATGGVPYVWKLDRLDAPRLAARALLLRPDDGLVDEVPAVRDLDPVAARPEAVEEEALSDRVLRGCGLDVDAVLEKDVGRPQHFFSRVDPEGEVVQAPASAERIRDVDERGRRSRR
jgi:hypothetical protein